MSAFHHPDCRSNWTRAKLTTLKKSRLEEVNGKHSELPRFSTFVCVKPCGGWGPLRGVSKSGRQGSVDGGSLRLRPQVVDSTHARPQPMAALLTLIYAVANSFQENSMAGCNFRPPICNINQLRRGF